MVRNADPKKRPSIPKRFIQCGFDFIARQFITCRAVRIAGVAKFRHRFVKDLDLAFLGDEVRRQSLG